MMARDAAHGAEDQATARAATTNLPPPYRHGLPPRTYVVPDETYETMRKTIQAMPSLSPTERHVFMRLLSYEGTGYDSSGGSKGGISQAGIWHDDDDKPKLQQRVMDLRAEEGRETPVPAKVKDLTIEDIFDAMRAYARQEFEEAGAKQFARISDHELAFQLFDLQFQYGFGKRSSVWQTAINATLHQLDEPSLEQQRVAFEEFVNASKAVGVRTVMQRLALATALSVDDQLRGRFVDNLRQAKAMELQRQSEYWGASRARIWGMTREP